MTHNYKYIVTGAGAAGLSLIYKIIKSGLLNKDRLLIIDKDDKASNDRTFCFWETEESDWEDIVFRSWNKAEFKSLNFFKSFELSPYTYKMIKGIDFYNFVKEEINNTENVDWVKEEVLDINEDIVRTNQNAYSGTYIFNSILKLKDVLDDFKSNTFVINNQIFMIRIFLCIFLKKE